MNVKATRDQAFEEVLAGLNEKQSRAVDKIDGPMLVIAGPGTGKTHMLASRIGKILQSADVQASNILCMTFTNAGVVAMRERLLKFIGPEAHNVNIYTFHSFCDSIIRNNLDRFGRQNLETLNELEQIEYIHSLIDELPYENALVKGSLDPHMAVGPLRNLFSSIKQEHWETNDLLEKIGSYLKGLPDDPDFQYKRKYKTFNAGDPKQKLIDAAVQKMERLKAGIEMYPKYEALLKKHSKYEFADMINWVIEAFKKDDDFLGRYQEQFQYILVDEYQDTNGSQHEVLQLLTSFWEDPNLFVVGDDDQSIYEFQGARLANIVDFYKDHQKNIDLVVLDNNYRSSKKILNGSKIFIEKNEERLINQIPNLTKELIAANPTVADFPAVPTFVKYPNPFQETFDICAQIEQLLADGVEPKSIAIIYKKHAISEPFVELFTKRGVPFDTVRPSNILEEHLTGQIIDILEYLDLEYRSPNAGDYKLFDILHFRFLQIPRADLQKIALYRSTFPKGERPSLRAIIEKPIAELETIGLSAPKIIHGVHKLLEEFIQDTANIPFYVLVEKILSRSNWVSYLVKEPNGLQSLQIVQTFKDFVKQELRKNPKLDIQALTSMMDQMSSNRISLPLKNYAQGGNKVQMMTAHGSKGLEFDYVFMPNCNRGDWIRKNHMGKFSYPDTITLSGSSAHEEVNRRLFYVSMTRAERHLHLSFPAVNFNEKKQEPAPFLNEYMEAVGVENVEERVFPEDKMPEYLASLQIQSDAPRIAELDKSSIDKLLKGFQLSASALNTFLNCPLSFFYERVISVPTISSPQASYGTSIHRALQEMYGPVNENKQLLAVPEVLNVFEEEMQKHAGYMDLAFYNNRLDLGKNNLKLYHDFFKNQIPAKVQLEMAIYQTQVDGVPIGGEIDRVNFSENEKEVRIIDYKTGKHKSARLKPPSEKEPYGGNYWRQLYFYHILFKAQYPTKSVLDASIVYTNPEKQTGEFLMKGLDYRGEDELLVRGWIKDTYAKIMDHDFYQGCGKPTCKWCDFVNTNELNLEILETEDELMESSLFDEEKEESQAQEPKETKEVETKGQGELF